MSPGCFLYPLSGEEFFLVNITLFGGVTNVTHHVYDSPVRNRGFQPQIIGDLRADFGCFSGQTYEGASGGLRKSLYWKLRRGLRRLLRDYGGIYGVIPPPDFQIRDSSVAAGRAPPRSQPQTCPPSQDRSPISKGRVSEHH